MNNDILNYSFQIAGYGMIGIFIFMLLFYLVIYLLGRIYPYKTIEDDVDTDQ
jgi:tetrahydromethanopterin S-methyltransferase subunit E